MAKFVLALSASAPLVSGHAALYSPVPRNSNDRDLPQFAGGKSPKCPCTCDNGLGGKGGGDDEQGAIHVLMTPG